MDSIAVYVLGVVVVLIGVVYAVSRSGNYDRLNRLLKISEADKRVKDKSSQILKKNLDTQLESLDVSITRAKEESIRARDTAREQRIKIDTASSWQALDDILATLPNDDKGEKDGE